MWGYWIIFAVYILLIIAGLYKLKLPMQLSVRYLIFSLFIDAFYISIVYKNIICQLIFGGLTMLVIFANLSANFIQSNKNKLIKRIELIFDLVIGLGLTIYLIYIIPNKDLQQLIIPIIAAVYGGLLTLVGVLLEIKHQEMVRNEDEKKKAEPLFDYSMILDEPIVVSGSKNCFPAEYEKEYTFDVNLLIDNSNKNAFKLKKVFHDTKWFDLTGNTVLLPNHKVILSFKFNEPFDLFMEVEDSLSNLYYYEFEVVNVGFINGVTIKRHTIRSLNKISKEEIAQRISKNEGEKNE